MQDITDIIARHIKEYDGKLRTIEEKFKNAEEPEASILYDRIVNYGAFITELKNIQEEVNR